MIRTGISASDAQIGDDLVTFQIGRITVAAVETVGAWTTITTSYGRVWRTSRNQLVTKVLPKRTLNLTEETVQYLADLLMVDEGQNAPSNRAWHEAVEMILGEAT